MSSVLRSRQAGPGTTLQIAILASACRAGSKGGSQARAAIVPDQASGGGRPASALAMQSGGSMIDAVFVVATVAFFALSLAYVRWCDRL